MILWEDDGEDSWEDDGEDSCKNSSNENIYFKSSGSSFDISLQVFPDIFFKEKRDF